ncbi:MAG TPA: SMP-30/gluconolactonase/LRE family protein [Xanthobacteraceae bacterium]|nr:SMP-30/gluconolactonase/LRE family protein [Xanthobacteraceae bacterium]
MQAAYEVLDERFRACFNRTAQVEKLSSGARWTEGPAYFPAGRYLVWSDIPNDRMLRYDECDGSVSVFRQPCGYANGHTVDREGRLVSCEHGGRRVSRTEHDGRITVIADRYDGKRLNSPNDVVVKSDGSIWFTDPPFGILSDYEGHKAESELGKNFVFRVDSKSGAIAPVADDFVRPNGLAFSVDETKLYIVDSHPSQRNMRVYDVTDDGKLANGKVFATCTAGRFDGFRLDDAGRIWTSTDEGVHCYDPDGTLIGKILVSEILSNVVFGGPKRNRLFITATTSLYAVMLTVNGAKTF